MFKYKQSSLPSSPLPSGPGCRHMLGTSCALISVGIFSFSTGGRNLKFFTGDSANGIPKKKSTPSRFVPEIKPPSIVETTTDDDDDDDDEDGGVASASAAVVSVAVAAPGDLRCFEQKRGRQQDPLLPSITV